MNTNLVEPSLNSISTSTLFQNLPESTSNFDVSYFTELVPTSPAFYKHVYDQRTVGSPTPYRYGSYQVFKADTDTNTFQFSSYINITSATVSAYYPQFMYQSIIKSASSADF